MVGMDRDDGEGWVDVCSGVVICFFRLEEEGRRGWDVDGWIGMV
jgi:hypothetical protein